jgi:haloalkane dehalogenase
VIPEPSLKTALRTDDSCFLSLPGYPFAPHYVQVTHPQYHPLRMHYLDEGRISDPVVLLLHGCPSWSYLYRKVIAVLVGKRLRVIAPDHIGCGKSDKLLAREDYSYEFYVDALRQFIQQRDLKNITLVCQDWGGPIGLRVMSEMPERFARVIATNTLLPNGEAPPHGVADWPGEMISQWVQYTSHATDIPVGKIMQGVCVTTLPADVLAAYDAPFPDARYKQGVMGWPSLIPITGNMPGLVENRGVWEFLEHSDISFMTAFSDSDPSTAEWEKVFQQRVKGAQGRQHYKIAGAGHMVQEDRGEVLAHIILGTVQG